MYVLRKCHPGDDLNEFKEAILNLKMRLILAIYLKKRKTLQVIYMIIVIMFQWLQKILRTHEMSGPKAKELNYLIKKLKLKN